MGYNGMSPIFLNTTVKVETIDEKIIYEGKIEDVTDKYIIVKSKFETCLVPWTSIVSITVLNDDVARHTNEHLREPIEHTEQEAELAQNYIDEEDRN